MVEFAEDDPFNVKEWIENPLDPLYKLEVAMEYLMFEELDIDTDKSLKDIQAIMQYLQQVLKKEGKLHLLWTRILDVIAHVHLRLFEKDNMKEKIERLILTLLTQDQPIKTIDWRIAKKLLSVSHIFRSEKESCLLPLISKDYLLIPFRREIDKALDDLVWLPSNSLKKAAEDSLQKLQKLFDDESSRDRVTQAFIIGRFDKSAFGLSHTLVCGEDGGLYLLLNKLSQQQQEDMVRENIVTKEYLKDKIKVPKQHEEGKDAHKQGESTGDRVVIGKGGFGTVRFALNLFRGNKASPGDVVCTKKSKSLTSLATRICQDLLAVDWAETNEEEKEFCINHASGDIAIPTLGDYFCRDVAEKVFAPHIFDMSIIAGSLSKEKQDAIDHRKGYTFMEVFPQNSAHAIFSNPKYQLWKYQKPYLISVLQATEDLLNGDTAFVDLKPENTLYDSDLFLTSMIDMGSALKLNTAPETIAESFARKRVAQFTPGFSPPELDDMDENGKVNMPKVIAYTCGMVIQDVAGKNTDYNNNQEIQELVKKLTHTEPDQRISIKEAIERLQQMGNEDYKEDAILRHYVNKVRESIENNRATLSINEDIHQTRKLHINQNVTSQDPDKFKDLETEDLFKKVDEFLLPEQNKHQVMVIFGSAGSGKSIALQLKFIDAVRSWEIGQPLPIYFNLANGIELETIIQSMNRTLGTYITFQDLRKKGAHLYIDSFDEGLGLESGLRETLIKEFMKALAPLNEEEAVTKIKFIISCRTDYLVSESNYKWFTPQANAFDKLLPVYIAPIDYGGHANLKDMIEVYAKHKFNGDATYATKTLATIEKLRLKEMITTGFMFYVILEVLPDLEKGEIQNDSLGISKQAIFCKYVGHYQEKELQRYNEDQKRQLLKKTQFINQEEKKVEEVPTGSNLQRIISLRLKELAKYIAAQLHLRAKFRLDQDASFFQAFGYDSVTPFKKQTLSYLLKVLPFKIESKYYSDSRSKKQSQEVKVGFIHDMIKNSYLLEAIQDEMKRTNGNSLILSSKSIVADRELVRFIADAVKYDSDLRQHLRKAIDLSKSDKSECAAIYAANSITILVASNYSFTCHDLSGINIRGANIRNGMFSGADFTGADLSSVNMANIQANGARLVKTNLKGAKFGILPDLRGHRRAVKSVSSSGDGKYVVSAGEDGTVRIWNMQTSVCLAVLKGSEDDEVTSVDFSSDGRYVASGSRDRLIKIWDAKTFGCLATLKGHDGDVLGVSFSHDEKYIASASSDRTVKIWDLQSFSCIATLEDHTDEVLSVSFSSTGKHVASGSGDKTVKIWEVETSKCLASLQGHTDLVASVSFALDGKFVASGSWDKTIKIWEVETSNCIATLIGHTDQVTCVSVSTDGKCLASGAWDNTVKIWELQNFKCLTTFEGHKDPVYCVNFSHDGRYVVSASEDKAVKIWEVQTSKCLALTEGHTLAVTSADISRSGKYIASASEDKTVRIWEVKTSKCLATLGEQQDGHTKKVQSISFSGDDKYLASGSADNTVKIWDVQTSKCLTTLEGHTSYVMTVALSEDGKLVASASLDKSVKIWEVQTSKCLATLEGHTDEVRAVGFSRDRKYLVSGSKDNTMKLWDAQTFTCLATLEGHNDIVMSTSFSKDGKYILSASLDNTVKIWQVQTSQCIATLSHEDSVLNANFSDDGIYVATASYDKIVRVWETKTFNCLATLEGHAEPVNSVSFFGSGVLVSASNDKTVRCWGNINGWFCDLIFSATETPLAAHQMLVEQVVISTQNKAILEGLTQEEIKEPEINDTQNEIAQNSTIALDTATKLSELFLKGATEQEERAPQKFTTINLGDPIYQNAKPFQKNPKEAGHENHDRNRDGCYCTIF